MQREALEFHDSVLAMAERSGDELRLLFAPAYVHRSSGDPARDAGTGWSAKVQLTLFGAEECQIPSDLPGNIWEGTLRVGESEFDNVVPVPLQRAAAAHVEIAFASGSVLKASGTRVSLLVVGSYEFIENVSAG